MMNCTVNRYVTNAHIYKIELYHGKDKVSSLQVLIAVFLINVEIYLIILILSITEHEQIVDPAYAAPLDSFPYLNVCTSARQIYQKNQMNFNSEYQLPKITAECSHTLKRLQHM